MADAFAEGSRMLRTAVVVVIAWATGCALVVQADPLQTIARVKASVVAIGTFERTRNPQFQFLGTGFAVNDGTLIVTNAHVVAQPRDTAKLESLVIVTGLPERNSGDQVRVREAKELVVDGDVDVAVLKIPGPALPVLKVRGSGEVKEGQEVFFTGFPIGTVLGLFPATHRGIVSAITPIAIPQAKAGQLDAAMIKRLTSGAFPVFQLDATAYPGNSGSPLYDPESGDVIGVVNMVLVKSTKESVLTQPSGITYAVPSSHILDVLKKAP
jgi:S1-C subfamily serine protease